MRLLLFDVDGTLLTTGGLSRRAFAEAVADIIRREASLDGYLLSGKTDPQIVRDLLVMNGLSHREAEKALPAALGAYETRYLEGLATTGAELLEGVRDVVDGLAVSTDEWDPDERIILGLLTGNLKPLVAPKLAAAGIPPASFRIGAYGSDHADRNKLPAIAVARAQELLGAPILPQEVVIVGDTPLDIACAKHFGAVSVAVASGDYTCGQLQDAEPDFVLADLNEWGLVEREIGCRR